MEQYLDHLHPSVLKEWVHEIKDPAQKISDKPINSQVENSNHNDYAYKEKKAMCQSYESDQKPVCY